MVWKGRLRFMRGEDPVRRTLKYLDSNTIFFRKNVRIFSMVYHLEGEHHAGARDFAYWHLPQVQFHNPTVQCVTYFELTPSPFIQIYLDSGKDIVIDIDSRTKAEICTHLSSFVALCKTVNEIKEDRFQTQELVNPANMGNGCKRYCICEVPGQVPCSAVVPLPYHLRGKYKYSKAELPQGAE